MLNEGDSTQFCHQTPILFLGSRYDAGGGILEERI